MARDKRRDRVVGEQVVQCANGRIVPSCLPVLEHAAQPALNELNPRNVAGGHRIGEPGPVGEEARKLVDVADSGVGEVGGSFGVTNKVHLCILRRLPRV